jgi:predicted nucleotidyltransferase
VVGVRDLVYYEVPAEERGRILQVIAKRLAREGGVVFAYAHGGFVRRSFFRDIDIAVWLKDASDASRYVLGLSVELEAEVRLPVDVQVLNEAPLSFKYRVVTEGRLLLSRDERLRKELVNTITREYLDFQCLCAFYGRREVSRAGSMHGEQMQC